MLHDAKTVGALVSLVTALVLGVREVREVLAPTKVDGNAAAQTITTLSIAISQCIERCADCSGD